MLIFVKTENGKFVIGKESVNLDSNPLLSDQKSGTLSPGL